MLEEIEGPVSRNVGGKIEGSLSKNVEWKRRTCE